LGPNRGRCRTVERKFSARRRAGRSGIARYRRVAVDHLAGRQRDCGIIVVSGRGSEEVERVVGIEMGADDFVAKPVPMRELVARIRAVHRRSARAPAPPPPPVAPTGLIAIGAVRVDLKRRVVSLAGESGAAEEPIHLTAAEFTALEALISAAPQPVTRETLCRQALRRPFHAEDRGVDQLILNLRRKAVR